MNEETDNGVSGKARPSSKEAQRKERKAEIDQQQAETALLITAQLAMLLSAGTKLLEIGIAHGKLELEVAGSRTASKMAFERHRQSLMERATTAGSEEECETLRRQFQLLNEFGG